MTVTIGSGETDFWPLNGSSNMKTRATSNAGRNPDSRALRPGQTCFQRMSRLRAALPASQQNPGHTHMPLLPELLVQFPAEPLLERLHNVFQFSPTAPGEVQGTLIGYTYELTHLLRGTQRYLGFEECAAAGTTRPALTNSSWSPDKPVAWNLASRSSSFCFTSCSSFNCCSAA